MMGEYYNQLMGLTPDGERTPERAAFERWYVENAFDLARDPLGSRDCGLQWKAWQAAVSLRRPTAPVGKPIFAILYEHDKGDVRAWIGTGSPPWAEGDPAWRKGCPLTVHGQAAPVGAAAQQPAEKREG